MKKKSYFPIRMIGVSLIIISLWFGNVADHEAVLRIFFVCLQVCFLLMTCSNLIVEGKPEKLQKEIYLLSLSIYFSILTILPVLYSIVLLTIIIACFKIAKKIKAKYDKN